MSDGCGSPTGPGMIRRGETVPDLGSGGGIDVFLASRKVGAGVPDELLHSLPDFAPLLLKSKVGATPVEHHLRIKVSGKRKEVSALSKVLI